MGKKKETISKDPLIKAYTIEDKKIGIQKNKEKAFLLFGEHARELISSETGFHLLTDFCQDDLQNTANFILENFILKMVIIANPTGRKIVEEGNFCWRGNQNKVDINRNWGFQWKAKQPIDDFIQTDPGKKKFSEPETKALQKAIRLFRPDIFLSVHSGMNSLMFPYAYSMKKPERNYNVMMKMVETIKGKYCPECDLGQIKMVVGYDSFGSSIDYIYETFKTPLVFVFEIYAGKDEDSSPRFKSLEKLKNKKNRGNLAIKSSLMSHGELRTFENAEDCFRHFNPLTKEEYDESVKKWKQSILELLSLSYDNPKN